MQNSFMDFIKNMDVDLKIFKIETKQKDYFNKRGKKKGTTHVFSLKDSSKLFEPPVIVNISVLDANNVYLYINKQQQPQETSSDFLVCKHLFFMDVYNFVEENKQNFKFMADSKGQFLERYTPDNIKKLGLEEKKIFYRTKFNKGEQKC